METRKIALIIFLIALIFLSLGVIVYIARQRSEINNLQTAKLVTSPVAMPANGNGGLIAKDGQLITEELIKTKIMEKQTVIKKKKNSNEYTNDELLFLDNPRQTVINELKAGR